MSLVKSEDGKVSVVCDLCGDSLPPQHTVKEAIDFALEQGWTYDREYEEDYCSECTSI